MKTYNVTYNGNSTRFQGFSVKVEACCERDAVESVYETYLDSNFFKQEDGTILDSAGNIIAEHFDTVIEYNNGYFTAEEI